MNEKNCKIVQDLLPSYIEGFTAKETNQYIEGHINQCAKCKQVLNNMKNDYTSHNDKQQKKKIKYMKKFNNKIKTLKIIILVIVLFFIATFTVIVGRKMFIISSLDSKASTYIDCNNFYKKIYLYKKDYYQTFELFRLNDQREKWILNYISQNTYKNIQTIIDGTTKYEEYDNEKSVTYNVNTKNNFLNFDSSLHTKNIFQLFKLALQSSIKNTTFYGKDCYLITISSNDDFIETLYIDKNTGLENRRIDTEKNLFIDTVIDIDYTFNVITEDDVKIPDNLDEYKKRLAIDEICIVDIDTLPEETKEKYKNLISQ